MGINRTRKQHQCLIIEKTILLAILITISRLAFSDTKRPTEFFPKNYVGDSRAQNQGLDRITRGNSSGAFTPEPRDNGFKEFDVQPSPQATISVDPIVKNTGQKIISISGFIAGETIPKGMLQIARAGKVLHQHKIPVRHISIVCNPLKFYQSIEESFAYILNDIELMRGYAWMSSVFRVVQKVPNRYTVTYSPVWLIETAQGETIVEGNGPPLEQMISPNGEFVSPVGSSEDRDKTATKPEGTPRSD